LHYVLATFVFLSPSVLKLTYIGSVGGDMLSGDEALVRQALVALPVLAASIFLPAFVRRFRRSTNGGPDLGPGGQEGSQSSVPDE
jgi:hypothetical protein